MEFIKQALDFVLQLDRHLSAIIQTYGPWTYGILFAVIFCETGFVVTPFLPGDSLLFAAGTFAALGALKPGLLTLILGSAAVLGDNLNYWIGHHVGPKVFRQDRTRFFKKEHLDRTHAFYEKHGTKAIVIARFMPIVRTFSPFVAGIGRMSYGKFLLFDVLGGFFWVSFFVWGGYFFGNIPFMKRNFTLVILAIIMISLLPAAVEFLRHRRRKRRAARGPA